MKKTLYWALLLAALLALLTGAAQAEPWAGSGTESDPWRITSAADLVALREYLEANENATDGKFFLLTQDISLSNYCGASKGDWTPIGYQDNDAHVFGGTFNGGGHTLSGLYIGNGGRHSALFTACKAGGTIKNLTVAGYVRGGYETGGIVGWNKGVITNCCFNGTVIGIDVRTGGIAGFTGNQSGSIISNSSVEGNISGGEDVGGITGFIKNSNLENCHFSGTITGTAISVGGIAGHGDLGAFFDGCTAAGDITGTSDKVGGIAGSCYLGTMKDCTFQSGTVIGNDQIGGIVGLSNAQLIENCESYGNVSSAINRAGGIAGETCGPIKNCENHGAVSAPNYAGGITGHTFSGLGLTGTVENCKNYGSVKVDNEFVGGIVGWAEVPITGCENHGRIEGYQDVGGIAGDTESTVTNCTNDGQVSGHGNVGSIIGREGGYTMTLKPNGAPGEDLTMVMTPGKAAAPECPFTHESLRFFAWNTKADGTGAWYRVGDSVTGSAITLYAVYMDMDIMHYETLVGKEEYAYPYLMDSYFMETGVTGLPGGWYAAPMNTNVTFPGRLYLTGDVNLLLTSGSTITCNGGIDVPPGSSLTIWAMPGGAGTLNATAAQFCAGIGGSKGKSNGRITINGGTVNATGNFGAGIGGGDLAAGGTVVINGGTVNATGANGSAGIGGGGYGSGGTVTINGGTITARGSVYSDTNQASAGIGAGRPRANGSQTLSGGSVTINGGTVTVYSGGGDGANAIGANLQHSTPGSLTIADGIKAFVIPNDMEYSQREAACRAPLVGLMPCNNHTFDNYVCHYCGIPMALADVFAGLGTESKPFLIQSVNDWNMLASLCTDHSHDYQNYWFRLANDLTVTTMIGADGDPFMSKFDGGGHTLTFNAANPDNDTRIAPFAYVRGATIRNLRTAGSVTGNYDRVSGLIGEVTGSATVENCRVSMSLSGKSFVSAFCIGDGGGLTLKGCVFDGSLSTGSRTGGFVGWTSGNLTIRDCLFAPASVSSNIYTFYYDDDGTHPAAITNSYCLTDYGTAQGKQAFSVTAGSGVTIDFGAPGTAYSLSSITAYPAGLLYKGTFYAGPGDAVTLNLTAESQEGTATFTASSGTLTQSGDAWTLTMPSGDVVISAVYIPAFGTPDFTLPAFLTTVEEEAFEGIAASVVDVPASCTSIGAHAFRNCPNLTQIRIPANCTLGAGVFDGCTNVYILGTAGSAAETYCSTHSNCVFVPVE